MVRSATEPSMGPSNHGALGIDELGLRARVSGILNRWPAVGLAVGVVRDGRLEFFHGHGAADIASNTPVTEDTIFRVGSITKTFTAIAVLQLWEQGRIDLDGAGQRQTAHLTCDVRLWWLDSPSSDSRQRGDSRAE